MKIFNKISGEIDSINTENKNDENDNELGNLNINQKWTINILSKRK